MTLRTVHWRRDGFHGLIMGGALVAGLLVGATYVWFRKGRAVTTIEARGNNHNFLRE